jgi:hypothetical protein
MDRVLAHPITTTFHDAFEISREDGGPMRPLGLLNVRDQLQAGQYATVHSWLQDVETVVHNYEASSGNPFEFAAVSEVRRCFTRERAKMRCTTHSLWLRSVAALRTRMSKIATAAPPRMKNHITTVPKVDVPKPFRAHMTEHQITEMLDATELMTADQIDGLRAAITDEPVAISSTSVDEANAQAIREYIEGRSTAGTACCRLQMEQHTTQM